MRIASMSTLVMALMLSATGPAAATHETPLPGCRLIRGVNTPESHDDDVTACRQDVWIHHGGMRAGNVPALGLAPLPSWNTTRPTGSFQEGGGFWFTNSITRQPAVPPEDARGSFVTRGSFTGVLDTLAVELYAHVNPLYSQDLNVELVVDDWQFFLAAVPDVRNAPAGNFQRVRFAFTDLYEAMRVAGLPNGDGAVHTIRLGAGGVWVVNDPMVWVYDATDAPAGVVFNHEALGADYTELKPTATG